MCNKAVEGYHFLTSGRAVTSGDWEVTSGRADTSGVWEQLPVAQSLPVDWGAVTKYCALIGYYHWQPERSRDPMTSKTCKLGHVTPIPQYPYWLSRALIGYYYCGPPLLLKTCYEVSLPSKIPHVRPTDCGGRAGETLQEKGRGNPLRAATGRSTWFCAILPKLIYLMKDWDSLNTELENLLTFNSP